MCLFSFDNECKLHALIFNLYLYFVVADFFDWFFQNDEFGGNLEFGLFLDFRNDFGFVNSGKETSLWSRLLYHRDGGAIEFRQIFEQKLFIHPLLPFFATSDQFDFLNCFRGGGNRQPFWNKEVQCKPVGDIFVSYRRPTSATSLISIIFILFEGVKGAYSRTLIHIHLCRVLSTNY